MITIEILKISLEGYSEVFITQEQNDIIISQGEDHIYIQIDHWENFVEDFILASETIGKTPKT